MLPNFLILGAPRCGTTTLYESLKQHPQIYLSPVKEPMFFILEGGREVFKGPIIPEGVSDKGQYQSLFQGAGSRKALGEASPCYLSHPKVPPRIKELLPDVKMIAILRNPVDRAYSHFLIHRLQGVEPAADFEEAFAAEGDRLHAGWSFNWWYREMGFYGRQIERYYSHFPPRQFRFFLLEDLAADPQALFAEIFRFLEVDERVRLRTPARHNPSGVPRHKSVHEFMTRPNFLKSQLARFLPVGLRIGILARYMRRNLVKPGLDGEVRRRVLAVFREDILKTQDLIHRDLSSWLEA